VACTKHAHEDKLLTQLERGNAICLTGQRTAIIRRVNDVNGLLRITYSQKGSTKHWLARRTGTVKVHVP